MTSIAFISSSLIIFSGLFGSGIQTAASKIDMEKCIECPTDFAQYTWVWNQKDLRLTSSGSKKLEKLKKKYGNDKVKIQKEMNTNDFEYFATYLMRDNPNRCPSGNHYGAKQNYVSFSKLCNKPNFCPAVPGL